MDIWPPIYHRFWCHECDTGPIVQQGITCKEMAIVPAGICCGSRDKNGKPMPPIAGCKKKATVGWELLGGTGDFSVPVPSAYEILGVEIFPD